MMNDTLFPAIEPHRRGRLAVDDLHTLYWEECGNPQGTPVLFLHGGPGGGIGPGHRRFFDPSHYRIVLFDQRGAGQSTPLGETERNSTQHLIADIEQLRQMLGVDRWLVFGGSWGSTLALAYGQAHPQRCLGFVLRGIFLCTSAEIDWFLHGMGWFYPEVHAAFAAGAGLGAKEGQAASSQELLQAYAQKLFANDAHTSAEAARVWSAYEGGCLHLLPQPETVAEFSADAKAVALGRLEAHYFLHQGFLQEDQLIRDVARISHLPVCIVQGRYDVVCPPRSAYRLHQAWPGSVLRLVADAGHAASEPGTSAALVHATEQFRQHGRFFS